MLLPISKMLVIMCPLVSVVFVVVSTALFYSGTLHYTLENNSRQKNNANAAKSGLTNLQPIDHRI